MHPVLRAAAERRYGVFTTVEALTAGYRHSEIQNLTSAGRWIRLRRGVLIAAPDLETAPAGGQRHRVDCLAVLLALGRPGAVMSHASAARLWGLPRPRSSDAVLRLTDPSDGGGGRASSCPARLCDRARPGGRGRCGSPRRCARRLRPGVAAGGRRRGDGCRAARRPDDGGRTERRRGLRRALARCGASRPRRGLADGRAESPLETRGRLRIVGSGFDTPAVQVEIWTPGRLVAVVDAWFEAAAVAVEFDGRVKYTEPWRNRSPGRVLWEEKRREDELRALGIRVLRVADADLGDGWHSVAHRLGALLAAPGPARRRFTAVPRSTGLRRTG